MPNVRALNIAKYNISKHRFAEVYHFCMQYNEWKDELKYKTDTVGSVEISGMPLAHSGTDITADLICRRVELSRKCAVIEQTVKEADETIYSYLLKAVTNEGISYNYLRMIMNIPCGKKMYYEKRRKFYWLMAQKI